MFARWSTSPKGDVDPYEGIPSEVYQSGVAPSEDFKRNSFMETNPGSLRSQ